MPRILLYQDSTANQQMFLEGVLNGNDLMVETLTLPTFGGGTEVFTLPAGTTIPHTSLQPSGGDFLFVQAALELVVAVPLFASGGDFSFLGGRFSAQAGYAISLRIHLTPNGMALPKAWCTVHVCGRLDAAGGGGGGAAFIQAVICCEIRLPALPIPGSFPLPRLHIDLPDLGLDLPDFELPSIDFPRLPAFPWSFGWPAIELPSLFLKLSWRSVDFSHSAGNTIVDITGLRLEGPGGRMIEADVHLVIRSGSVTTGSCIDLYESGGKRRLAISHWHRSESCLAVGWTGAQLEAWLGLLLPEMFTPNLPDDCDIVLRFLRDESGLREVRLDYVPTSAQVWSIRLPGFQVHFREPQFYSLVLWQQTPEAEEVNWRLALLAVMAAGSNIRGHTTFALADGNQSGRELHNDRADGGSSEDLLTLTATPLVDGLALVVCDLPMPGSADRARFFQRVSDGVVKIDWSDPETLELPAITAEQRLAVTDVLLTFDLNAKGLPFLRSNGADNLKQYLEVIPGQGVVDFPQTRFVMPLQVKLHLGAFTSSLKLDLSSSGEVAFNWERFALDADGFKAIAFRLTEVLETEFLGLTWHFENAPGASGVLFTLDFSDGNIAIRQAQGAKITASFTRITSEPLVFSVENFVLGPRGLSIDARMERCHAKLNGVGTTFQFDDASLQMRDNKITGFTISGSGTLPPALVGEAKASVALQFGQSDSGNLELLSAGATLSGRNLLHCQSTRFEFTIDGMGLRFVNERGDYHLYFTLTGVARFKPLAGDDSQGPLTWLPKIEIQFVDCPLAGDASVLKKHIRFHVEMPRKESFNFLGCFSFELRGFGFVPEVDFWEDRPAAMILCGQIKFAVDGGDVVDARFDFHNLYVALPEPGSFVPRLRCRNLGLKLRVGEAFELEGLLDFIEGEEVEPGWRARGFRGQGGITIMGLPKFHATFAFLRVLQQQPEPRWVRAWFLYAEVRHLSLRIPAPVPLFIREIGLGFGYRYTLAAIKRADELDDIKVLIRELDKLALSQGDLSNFNAWRLDVEDPPERPRWTLVLRGMLATASASSGATDWHPKEEKHLPNILLMDAVMGLRSDFTFFLNVRGWLFTNYRDYDDDVNGVRTGPLMFGYALFQPRKKRLLVHAASSDNPKFGDHPPLWDFMKQAIRSSHYSATTLIEPGLFHQELGWPNMLRWGMKWGPFQVECRGGALFRVSRREMVQGMSFEARGSLSLSAGFSAGPVGARLWAEARLAFGARYIFVLGLDRLDRTAFYAAVGLELCVKVGIALWIRIKLGFCKITLSFSFSFELAFSALLEVGAQLTALPGCRGTADVSLRLMGRGLHFHVHVGINESTVNRALSITESFLKVGLEATEVEPLPGERSSTRKSSGAPGGGGSAPFAPVLEAEVIDAAQAEPPAPALDAPAADLRDFKLPHYDIVTVPMEGKEGTPKKWFLVLVPSARDEDSLAGFVAIPPAVEGAERDADYVWDLTGTSLDGKLARVDMLAGAGSKESVHRWEVHWNQAVGKTTPKDKSDDIDRHLRHLLRHAYIPANPKVKDQEDYNLGDVDPLMDPPLVQPKREGEALRDPRVRHPADQNYEAAVRGALEQFEGSPYLKHDPGIEFEEKLLKACRDGEFIYRPDEVEPKEEDTWHRQSTELRSTVINGLVEDVREYARLCSEGAVESTLRSFRERSVAFGLGLIFEMDEAPAWLDPDGEDHEEFRHSIRQPANQDSATADGDPRSVRAYNTHRTSFRHHPPRFEEARHFASASTVAIAWDLKWDVEDVEPEEHLRFYKVLRRPLGFEGAQKEFQVKPAELLLKEPVRDADDNPVKDPHGKPVFHIIAIPGRFQFVDHFAEESEDDISALPAGGRTYLYTITPVDLAGQSSPRSFSVAATRRPNRAPNAPQSASLKLSYEIEDKVYEPQADAMPLQPDKICVEVLEPPAPDDPSFVPAQSWRLVLRRERTLPIGSYPADSASDSPRQAAPASFARLLPSDILVPLKIAKRENRDDGRYIVWEVPSADIPEEAIPKPSTTGWKPTAWRVLIQAGTGAASDQSQVWSSLAPVQLDLEFRRGDAGVVHHPELLEWVLRPMKLDFLRPSESQAEASYATVPRPSVGDHPENLVAFNLGEPSLAKQPVSYLSHPKRWRVARLRWNHTAAAEKPQVRELAAGYRLFEFDVDEHLSDEFQDKDFKMRRFLELTREVRQVRLLPANQVTLTPAENLAPDQWEAWYPSSARREYLRRLSALSDPHRGRGEDQWLSPWFSWRDSYLEWPVMPGGWSEVRLTGNTPVSLAGCEVERVTGTEVVIVLPDKEPEGVELEEFARRKVRLLACEWLEFGDLPEVEDNVLRHGLMIVEGDKKKLSFPLAQFVTPPAVGSQVTLSQPQANVHWFMEALVTRIEAAANVQLDLTPQSARFHGVQADPCLIPPGKATNLEGFRAETAAGEDAYGWNLLKRMGLSAAVVFRNVRTGLALPPDDVWRFLHQALTDMKKDATPAIQALLGHLHVELLFQPGRSVRMDKDPDQSPDAAADLLALVQFSLRPRIKQSMVYARYTLRLASSADSAPVKVEITAPSEISVGDKKIASPFSFIVEGDNLVVALKPGEPAPATCPQLPDEGDTQRGVVRVLVRHRGDHPSLPRIEAADPSLGVFVREELSPVSWEAARFPDLKLCWYDDPTAEQDERDLEPETPGAYAQWDTLKAYLRAAGVSEPARDAARPVEKADEAFDKELNASESLNWLRRMFNFSEDFKDCEKAEPLRGEGPWLATAYPQANTQLFATPRNGRLEVAQLIDDAWAHAYRYFALPAARYDQLWLGLAQSAQLYPDIDQRQANLAALLGIDKALGLKPEEGGLDVSLPRIRRVAPPLVLASGRLDNPTPAIPGTATDPSTRQPGIVWEVILAKHSEQLLSERNRMLAQSLEFQHVAWTMNRRFAFLKERRFLFKSAFPPQTGVDWSEADITRVENQLDGELPPDPSSPDWIVIPPKTSEVTNANRSLLLADRLDPLEHDAVALQWRHLPFFYEHRLLLVAQAGHAVSPIVTVTQRDFGFESPPSVPVEDARITDVDGTRMLVVDLRLARVWDCLPAESRTQWAIENPDTAAGDTIRPGALPDPEVVYELINSTLGTGSEPLPVRDVIARLAVRADEAKLEWEPASPSPRFTTKLAGVFKPDKTLGGRGRWLARLGVAANSVLPAFTQAVSSRYDFDLADLAAAGLTALPPERVELHWHGEMTPEQSTQLALWADAADPSFAAALRGLIARAAVGQMITVEASAGLDQVSELDPSWQTRVALSPARLVWSGGLSPVDAGTLEAWWASTPFKSTLEALVSAARAEQRAALVSQPTQPIVPPLPAGVVVMGTDLVKTAGTLLTRAELDQLRHPSPTWEVVVQDAARALGGLLETIDLAITDPAWRSRPALSEVVAQGLQEKLLIARGLLKADQPVTHTQASLLLAKFATTPGKQVIRNLYRRGELALLGGGSLQLRSRRSIASGTQPADISTLPL